MKKGLYFINTLQMAVRYIYSAARRFLLCFLLRVLFRLLATPA